MLLEPGTAYVSLSFDDGHSTQYNAYYPVMADQGVRATFYVITSRIGARGHLTWTQLSDLSQEGNEIGSHTHTHPHLTELSSEALERELSRSAELLRSVGCRTLAYPYGEYDPKVIRCAEKLYFAARGYYDLRMKSRDFGFNVNIPADLHKLKTIPTETATPAFNKPLLMLPLSQFQRAIIKMTKSASVEGAWIIFVFHGGSGIPFKLRWIGEFSTKFRWMCKYLSNNSAVRILPIFEAARLLSGH
jgi:peptidoglycan/xylan/chitin deacetylase (PgdA/CDA1 family)